MSSLLAKIIRADPQRRTRFHTLNGQLVLSADMLAAVTSTLARHCFQYHPNLPWITYPAIRFLDDKLTGRRLFEFGSGTSTAWWTNRCSEVHSVENNAQWFAFVSKHLRGAPNVRLTHAKSDFAMVASIGQAGGRFDAVVIDGQPMQTGPFKTLDEFRVECLRAALPFCEKDAIFIIDNTDALPQLNREIDQIFSSRNVYRFPGWVPGIFHPNETTIVFADAPDGKA